MRPLAVVFLAALLIVPVARASDAHPTQAELEGEVMCPVCGTTLDQSESPAAQQIKRVIARRIAAGDTKSEIKATLVDQFGESVLAAPPKRGFNLIAWLLPLVGLGLAAIVLALLARRWSSSRAEPAVDPSGNGRAPLDPELERQLDEELARFDA